jgi:hypothetical protein
VLGSNFTTDGGELLKLFCATAGQRGRIEAPLFRMSSIKVPISSARLRKRTWVIKYGESVVSAATAGAAG